MFVEMAVDTFRELVMIMQELADPTAGVVQVACQGVDLHPIAGRQNGRFLQGGGPEQRTGRFSQPGRRERETFADRDGRAAMVDADHQEVHDRRRLQSAINTTANENTASQATRRPRQANPYRTETRPAYSTHTTPTIRIFPVDASPVDW